MLLVAPIEGEGVVGLSGAERAEEIGGRRPTVDREDVRDDGGKKGDRNEAVEDEEEGCCWDEKDGDERAAA